MGRGRRGHGEGSIYKRSDGRWVAEITLEPGVGVAGVGTADTGSSTDIGSGTGTGTGRRKAFYGKTRQEVRRAREREMHVLTPEQARTLLAAAAEVGDRFESLYVLALSTGMRPGELLALRWRDVELEGAHPHVQVVATLKWRAGVYTWEEPKSKRSRRQIALAAPAVDALRHHRHQQRLERLTAGPMWVDHGVVFCNEIGLPLSDGHVRRRHWRLLRAAGLPRVRVHDLRHTCATLLLGQRVNPKIVSEMLGHSTVAITLDIYSHVLPDMQQDAAAAMAVALGR